jgi:glycosyltransferase involved in cell wall biosynthesis
MAHPSFLELNNLNKNCVAGSSTMKVVYFAYIDRKVGPYFHAIGFAAAFSKFVNKLVVVGLRDTNKILNYNRPKALRVLKKLQPHITWDIKLILKNVLRIPREYSVIKRERPDIVILRYELYTFSAAMLAWLFKVPLIIEANGSPALECDKFGSPGNGHLARFFESRIIGSAKALNVVSNELRNYFIRDDNISKEKINVIPNGVDLKKFKPISTDVAKSQLGLNYEFIVGYTGSFSLRHDLTTLIKAFRIAKKRKDMQLVLVGDGKLYSKIEKLVAEYGLNNSVVFVGRVSHDLIATYIAAMDITVTLFPPTWAGKFHGSPIKIFEYMAMKKAIITTKIGQLEEIIADGHNGFLVDEQDEKAVARKIITLAEDESLRAELGRNAHKTIIEKRYTWEENAKKNWKICKEVVKQTQSIKAAELVKSDGR